MTPDDDCQARLRALEEDNEALRYASLAFGDLADRLSLRVRDLERRLRFYERLLSAIRLQSVDLTYTGMPAPRHSLATSCIKRLPAGPTEGTVARGRRSA